MASWKLIVEDYGKIKSAEIEIAPLTLFVGDNNSGKSYLLSLLWGIEKFGVSALIGEKYENVRGINTLIEWLCEQIDIAVEKKKYTVSLAEISDLLNEVLNEGLKKNKDNLVKKIFNNRNVNIGKLRIELGNLQDICLHLEMDKKENIIISLPDEQKFGFPSGLVREGQHRKEKAVQWLLITMIYCSLLDIRAEESEINESIYLPAARTGFMLTKDIINKVGRKSTFNLSEEKEAITPFTRPINQFLDVIGDLSAETSGSKENLALSIYLEKEMANGTIEISSMPSKEVQYVPAGYKKGMPLRLVSAVVTELSPLILILKHQQNICRFYYEEPEICLHPQLQSRMGKIIGRIVNSGIGMVITTHSDIIMQHINNMIKLAKREDCQDICEKLGYTQLDLLSHDQVKVYQLSAKDRRKTEVKELACGENGFVIPTFNDALDGIMNEAYEIQG